MITEPTAPRTIHVPDSSLKLTLCLLFATGAYANTITLTLSSNYPADYYFYSYVATDNSIQANIPVAPYLSRLSDTDGLFTNTPAFTICYDLNNPTNVGVAYSGHFVNNVDTASLEATYLANRLNLAGNGAAPIALKGTIALAIWEITFPSSTKTDGSYFPADAAAGALEYEALQAVTSGTWTLQDASLYPTFIPDDKTSQRFGVIFTTTVPVALDSVPEPGGMLLLGSGVAVMALLRMRRSGRRPPVAA